MGIVMPKLEKKSFWDKFKRTPKPCKHKHRKPLYDPETNKRYAGQYLCSDCKKRVIIPSETLNASKTAGRTSGFPVNVWKS